MSSGEKRSFLAVPETGWSCSDLVLAPAVLPDCLSPMQWVKCVSWGQ